MKIAELIVAFQITLLGVISARAQSNFQNLNFEQANPISAGDPSNPSAVTAASAFPSWSVFSGSVQLTEVNYNNTDTGTTTVGLVSTANPFFPALDGNYSVLLQGGVTASSASISQTGLIPAGSQSLLFEAELEPQGGPGLLEVSIGGQDVPFMSIETEANYTLYGANIAAWAGDSEQLSFSAPEDHGANNWLVDDITFSTVATTPEPDTLVLTGMGGVCFAFYRWCSRRKSS